MKNNCVYPDPVPLWPLVVELLKEGWEKLKPYLQKLFELVKPPPDIEVRSTEGNEYSGLIVIDHNEIETGAVARVGNDSSKASGQLGGGSLVTPPSRHNDYDPNSYLRSWAEDPRQEDEPWRYR